MTVASAQALDRLGYGDSCIHRIDGRVKLLVALVFILCVTSFPKYTVSALIPFFALPVALLILGGVPAKPVLRALAVASPFAVLVGIFNPWIDRAAMFQIGPLVITGGVLSFLSILIRFALSLGIVLALIATTSLPGLLHAMVRLGIPRPFVAQVQMLYRYLFLLIDEGRQLHTARILRDPRHRFVSFRLAGRLLSTLLWRTWERADRIYHCMKVRGFNGDFPTLRQASLAPSDVAFAALVSVACVAARVVPVPALINTLIAEGAPS